MDEFSSHIIAAVNRKSRRLQAMIDAGKKVSLARIVLQRELQNDSNRFEEICKTHRPSCSIFEEESECTPNVWFSTELLWRFKINQSLRNPSIVRPVFNKM